MSDDAIRLLIVEDNPADARLVLEMLKEGSKTVRFDVAMADSLASALEHLRGVNCNAILLDLGLPDSQSLDTLRSVHSEHPEIPIVVLTVLDDEESAVKALGGGAQDYIIKGRTESVVLVRSIRYAIERKRVADALVESEKKYRLLVDSAAESIMVAQDGMLRLVNPTTVTMTGFSEQELTSKPFSSLIHPDDRAMVVERYQKRIRGEAVPNQYAFRVLTKDGSTKWVDISAISIEWEGRPATLNFLTDTTERKRAEEELRSMTTDALESAQKAEAYFDFLAHDIANILSPMIAYADMLKVRPNNPEQVIKFSSKILEQGQRASSLISNLRRLEGIEKTHPNEIDTIDLRTLFSSLEDSIRSDFPKKDITISYGLQDVQSMNVKGGEWVENVFKCVYDNAVRYSTGSAVKLEVSASLLQQEGKKPCWQIEISDYGLGIPDNVKSHFGESINVADREFKGVASSLPFCCSMIKCLGGELLVQDRIPGDHKQGTRIIIRLPKGE